MIFYSIDASSECTKEDGVWEERLVFIPCIFSFSHDYRRSRSSIKEVTEDKAERAAVSLEGTSRSGVGGDDFSGSLWGWWLWQAETHKKRSERDKSNHFVPFLEVWDSLENFPELIQSVSLSLSLCWWCETQLMFLYNSNTSVWVLFLFYINLFKWKWQNFGLLASSSVTESFSLMNQWTSLLLSK